ncbi:methylated-DNA--[protein]-cysteine S-methyltransferase [Tepidanaerobacter syntrophicus]|uniref:methylated-DNA--[protein]-cysteine S-methyltransferase n=1 Tax=Tepidanaerobacter syntrophicus TaxID=224999 RepID=UPI002490A7B0|nr:methylated-DNA--[protein]-cysteine S-methyltransferase [Tepidanaerobacter syntrophicus]
MEPAVYWGFFLWDDVKIHLAVSEKGLCYILWPNKQFKTLEEWTTKYFSKSTLIYNQRKIEPYKAQIEEYFKGQRRVFDIPLDLKGTDFQISVWEALLNIPYGTTKTYSQVAAEIGRPKATRAVGGAIGANPVSIVVPCHRVIGKDGSLTGFGGGLEIKKKLLKLEGISSNKH